MDTQPPEEKKEDKDEEIDYEAGTCDYISYQPIEGLGFGKDQKDGKGAITLWQIRDRAYSKVTEVIIDFDNGGLYFSACGKYLFTSSGDYFEKMTVYDSMTLVKLYEVDLKTDNGNLMPE